MADKEYLLGNNARELVKFTNRVTKPISDDVSWRDMRAILKKIAALDDIRDVRMVCGEIVKLYDKKAKEGFSKRDYNDYGKEMRQMAKNIVRYIHAANGRMFETEHDDRLELIGEGLDECSLLLEFVQICLDEGIISLKTSQEWTKKVTDVKYPAASWKKKDGARAGKIKTTAQAREDRHQVDLVKTAIREVREERTAPK